MKTYKSKQTMEKRVTAMCWKAHYSTPSQETNKEVQEEAVVIKFTWVHALL